MFALTLFVFEPLSPRRNHVMSAPAKKQKIKPSSAKNKGRNFQKEIAADIRALFPMHLEEDDVGWCSMGASGVDIKLSPLAQKLIPFDIECKNVENPNIWSVICQAWARDDPVGKPDRVPAAVLRKNRTKPVAVVPLGWIHDLLTKHGKLMGPRATLETVSPDHTLLEAWLLSSTDAKRTQEHSDVFEWLEHRWRIHDGKTLPFWKTVSEELGGANKTDGVLFNRSDKHHVIFALITWDMLKALIQLRADFVYSE